MFYKLIAIIVLIAFYGIFFLKQFAHRSKGEKSDQGFSISNINTESAFGLILTAAVILVGIAEVASVFFTKDLGKMLPAPLRIVGMLLALIGTAVFGLSAYTLRDNWSAGGKSDSNGLVRDGIYSWSRNPAFLGFDLLFAGILLMFYSTPLLILSVFAAVMFHIQIMVEERRLTKTFGAKYIDYKKTVRRYFGKRKAD